MKKSAHLLTHMLHINNATCKCLTWSMMYYGGILQWHGEVFWDETNMSSFYCQGAPSWVMSALLPSLCVLLVDEWRHYLSLRIPPFMIHTHSNKWSLTISHIMIWGFPMLTLKIGVYLTSMWIPRMHHVRLKGHGQIRCLHSIRSYP